MQVPVRTKYLIVGPASQVNIHVIPNGWESLERPSMLAEESQQLADQFNKPVVLITETEVSIHGDYSRRHVFNPKGDSV